MSRKESRPRAGRNRTIRLSPASQASRAEQLLQPDDLPADGTLPVDRVIHGDALAVIPRLPGGRIDLIFADPPYNLGKDYNGRPWAKRPLADYEAWLGQWLPEMKRLLKPDGSIYVCADWRCSAAVQRVLERDFRVQNRITWKREKGRGSKRNWKNAAEDIWFATVKAGSYTFNVDDVKLRRRVIAPYRDADGRPKDWQEDADGRTRLTYPSNVWTDLTVPFWSMPENTDHPTQKPEKLLAKVVLAGSDPGELVFDPFLGSGTTAVTACKLGRRFLGIERDQLYACLALERLARAREDDTIQGYDGRAFRERNTKA